MGIEEIYNQNIKRVYGFFYVKTFDQMLAEDLTSKTFTIMLEKLQQDNLSIKNSSHYLSGVMRNVWLRHLQEKYSQNIVPVEGIEDFESYVDETIDQAKESGLEKLAENYVDRLPEKQKIILQLRLIEKKTLKEITEILDKNMNYVRTTQKRGIANLRKMLLEDAPIIRKETA